MDNDPPKENPRKVKLFEERGPTSRFVYAEITDAGDLLISAQDVGDTPEEVFGDRDYEWWVYIMAKDKDWVLLALIEAVFGGRFHASDEFREWVKSVGIPYKSDSYC
jgi:hypothetical protein